MNELAIVIEKLRREFKSESGRIEALKDVNLSIKTGTLTALVGPDGAGKTTLLRIIAGLLRPAMFKGDKLNYDTDSKISVLEIDVTKDPQAVQDLISYMPQKFGLYEDLSVQENLDLYADLHGVFGKERKERYEHLLRMTNLAKFTDRLAGRLSGGMKQKLGLACTLVRSPKLLFLDEPTVGVDPLSRLELWQIVNELVKQENLSVVVSTAYLDEAERCEDVYIMHEGCIVAEGTPKEICGKAAGRCYLVECQNDIRSIQTELFDDKKNIVDAVPEGSGVRIVLQDGVTVEELRKAHPTLSVIKERAPHLEDSFMIILNESDEGDFDNLDTTSSKKSSEVVIKVENLVRRFGDFTAVDNTSFEVRRGEIFGLLGPNGAGKTTTFRMLCGLLPASSGVLNVAGVNLRTAPSTARKKIGYVAQKFSLYGNLTVKENLAFFAGLYSLKLSKASERIKAVMQEFNLIKQAKTPSAQLPGGYKQRLSMAVGLLHEPEILFLDEPTSGTDPLARRNFWRRISDLASKGITIVITTHFMEEAEYCDRIVIQDAGKILALGTPKEVREQAKRPNMEEAFISIVEANRGMR